MTTAEPDERVLISPQVELTRTMLDAASANGKLLVIGNLYIRPDVPAGLLEQKLVSIRVVGVLIACESVLGAMLNKLHTVGGPTIALPDTTGHAVRNLSETLVVSEYLAELPDDSAFINLAAANFSAGISPELLRQKIRSYYNGGSTRGPASLLGILRARSLGGDGEYKIKDVGRE